MVTMSPASAASYAAGAVHLDRLQFRIDHPIFLHVEALVQLAFRDFIVCARVYQVSTTVPSCATKRYTWRQILAAQQSLP